MALSLAHTLFSLLLLLPTSAVAQTNGKVTVGRSLSTTDSSPWVSPSGEFAFGFRQPNGSDFFLLSIWYDNIPDRTIVWYANGEKLAPRGSKVNLTADRGLVLTSSQGEELWTSSDQSQLAGAVASGVMNDTGNFVLEDSNFKNLWQSFQHPSDTMLPTQIMERGGVLSSRQSETNFSKGRFQLRFRQETGNLVLNTINLPTNDPNGPYYQIDSTAGDLNTSNSGKQLIFNASGYIYILRENDERITIEQESLPTGNLYFRVTLNFDGIFTLYSHPKTSAGNESWTPIWSVPDNICQDIPGDQSMTGVCGYNSVCKINPKDRRPICECPKRYSLLDPNDPYGSCKPDFIQAGCKEDELNSQRSLYYLEELTNTNWPFSDYMRLPTFTEENCKNSCLQDCMCAVAIFSTNNICWKKKLPLSNGRFSENDGGKVFIKVRKDNSTLPGPSFQNPVGKKKNQDRLILAGSVLLGCSLFVIFILIAAICHGFFYKKAVSKIDRNGVDMESGEEDKAILTDWAYDCFQEGTLDVLVGYDREAMDDMEKLERFVKVAIWCIQEGPSLRPTMRKVTHMLEGVVDVPIPPCPSPFNTT
ncbi:hypothetical protein FH972_009669 [Carpinus fangiana]|uniref:Bulb-type lectin domain-containing protein n=1 Tax=Carpinus fangiana TaxID=176857 RepID=A0A660KL02_9ROSI|nr:hypothetical protein FH972_009669 [Carpinus fangiana]